MQVAHGPEHQSQMPRCFGVGGGYCFCACVCGEDLGRFRMTVGICGGSIPIRRRDVDVLVKNGGCTVYLFSKCQRGTLVKPIKKTCTRPSPSQYLSPSSVVGPAGWNPQNLGKPGACRGMPSCRRCQMRAASPHAKADSALHRTTGYVTP